MAETKKRDYGKISILKLKGYAEKHTALFTAIFSALIAATTVYLQLCYYVYKYGQLSYFNIDVNTVRLVNDSNKFNILFCIVISAVMLAMNYFGYYFYRKNSLFKYFCGLFPLSLFMSFFLFDYTCKFQYIDIAKNHEFVIVIFVLAILFIPFSNIFVIICAVNPSIDEMICRLENKYLRVNRKYNENRNRHIIFRVIQIKQMLKTWRKIMRKSNNKNHSEYIKIQSVNLSIILHKNYKILYSDAIEKALDELHINIDKFKNECEQNSKILNSHRISNPIIGIAAIILVLSIIVLSFFSMGYLQEKSVKTIDVIESSTYFSENNTDCAIIYQNDEYILVSPCYIKDKELVINTSYQYRTKIIGIKKHIVHFDKMTVKTQDDLDNYICK